MTRNHEVEQFNIVPINDMNLASDSLQVFWKWAACILLHTFQQTLRVSRPKNRNIQVIMADACSLSKKVSWTADPHMVAQDSIYKCWDDFTAHLKNCFLSCADLKEHVVILQSAGFQCLSHGHVKKLSVFLSIDMVLESTGGLQVMSVPRTQRNSYQRQKSRRDKPCHSKGGVSAI